MLRVNEIFHSLQGEGYFAGVPAVFVRLSGCNLSCPFCDTDHSPFTEMTEEQIVSAASAYPTRHIVITGGEPALQLNTRLTDLLHQAGFFIQIETNGTVELPKGIDWITCSPKSQAIALGRVNELKVLFDGTKPIFRPDVEADVLSLQPLDTGNADRNASITAAAVEYVKTNPSWRLSLQTHKLLNIR
ncbi:MAG: radical SAM protein [Muribaculaceae bacterium]|nr:radical SAM protein [Muribaculaceae bacterium]